MKSTLLLGLVAAMTLGSAAVTASAQDAKQIEPVVPAGPPVPLGPNGPALVPLIAVEDLEGVETVTLNTPRGPVVVISWPTSGATLNDETNVDFSRLDADADGYLTSAELQSAGAAAKLSARFEELDTSGDDKLSFNEVAGWVHR